MLKRVLGNRALLVLGVAESVSGIGSWVTTLAVFALVIFRGQGTVVQSTGIFLAALLPLLLFSPAAGWLTDRFDRKWLMIGSELLAGVVVAGLIFSDNLLLIYALLALQSTFASVMTPARQAVVPDLVSREDLTRANAFLQQLSGIVKVGAPILGGALLAVVNPHTAIVLDVISYVLSAVILSRLPALPPHRDETRPGTADPESPEVAGPARPASGLQVLRDRPLLRLLFFSAFMTTVIIIGFDVLSSIFIRDVLQGTEGLYGLLIGLVGLGTVASAGLLLLAQRQRNLWRDVNLGLLMLGVLPLTIALAAWLGLPAPARILVAGGCLLGGLGIGFIQVQGGTLIQVLSPPELLGRVGGLYQSTAVAGQMVGLLLTPLLVPAVLPVATYLALGALGILLLVLYIVAALRRTDQATGKRALRPLPDPAMPADPVTAD